METDQERLTNADELSHQLVRFMRLLERAHANFHTHDHNGLEKAAYVLIAHLTIEGPKRASALAEAVHSDPSTVSRQVSTLVKAGLVERRADPMDGRACVLAATDEGRRLFDTARQERNRHIDRMLGSWPTERRRQLVELFSELNNDFENYRPHFATATPEQREATR